MRSLVQGGLTAGQTLGLAGQPQVQGHRLVNDGTPGSTAVQTAGLTCGQSPASGEADREAHRPPAARAGGEPHRGQGPDFDQSGPHPTAAAADDRPGRQRILLACFDEGGGSGPAGPTGPTSLHRPGPGFEPGSAGWWAAGGTGVGCSLMEADTTLCTLALGLTGLSGFALSVPSQPSPLHPTAPSTAPLLRALGLTGLSGLSLSTPSQPFLPHPLAPSLPPPYSLHSNPSDFLCSIYCPLPPPSLHPVYSLSPRWGEGVGEGEG